MYDRRPTTPLPHQPGTFDRVIAEHLTREPRGVLDTSWKSSYIVQGLILSFIKEGGYGHAPSERQALEAGQRHARVD